jgi:hypothetical protein
MAYFDPRFMEISVNRETGQDVTEVAFRKYPFSKAEIIDSLLFKEEI